MSVTLHEFENDAAKSDLGHSRKPEELVAESTCIARLIQTLELPDPVTKGGKTHEDTFVKRLPAL